MFQSADQGRSALPVDGFEYSAQTRPRFGVRCVECVNRLTRDGQPYRWAGEVNLFGEENWAELYAYGV